MVDSRKQLPRDATSSELEYLSTEGRVTDFLPRMTEVYDMSPSQEVGLRDFQQVPTRLTHKGKDVLGCLQRWSNA